MTKIIPKKESSQEKKKYRREDMLKGIFKSRHPEEKTLATTYKKYLY